MARPKEISLTKMQQKKVTSLYLGTKKRAGMNAHQIAKELNVPRRQVLFCLEQSRLAVFSEGSYA